MEVIPNNPLLLITQEDVTFARVMYEMNDLKRINESIDAILEWMGKQDHLVESSKHITRDYIERIFLLARGSTEKAKTKIDKLFMIRGLIPEICLHRSLGEFNTLRTCVTLVPLPKLTSKEKTRVVISQFSANNLDELSMLDYCRYGNMIGEYRMYYDYNFGDRVIIDFNHQSIISKLNPVIMKKYSSLAEIYGLRIKGLHIINAPQYIDTLITLIKSIMSEKVADRIYVHGSYMELHQYIDKEILPEDFGGDEMSIAKLAEKWKEHLSTPEIVKLIEDQDKLITDESKRTTTNFNQEYLGMPGSFRKLNVD